MGKEKYNKLKVAKENIYTNFEQQIGIKYHSDEMKRLNYENEWIDLYVAKNIDLKENECIDIPLGISINLPREYEAYIILNEDICNSLGIVQDKMQIIDSISCKKTDMWSVKVHTTKPVSLKQNDVICKFKIVNNAHQIKFIEI